MKRPIRIVLVALVLTGLFLAGCGKRAVSLDITKALGQTLLYLGKDGDDPIVVDPAEGKRYHIRGQAGAVLDPLPAFAEFSLGSDAGQVFLSTGTALSARLPIIDAGGAAEAAVAYPRALLEGMLWNGGEYALQDYTLKSTKLLADEDGKLTAEFVADVMPVRDQFSPFAGSGWGTPGSDGYVRGLRLIINLYGNNGRYCLYEPGWRTFASGTSTANRITPETRYRPASYDDASLAWEEGKEIERVLYEDDACSYIYGVRLRRGQTDYFETTIYRIDAITGERLAMFDLKRNTISVKPFALSGRVLYLSTAGGPPYSEVGPAEISSIDLDTGRYTVLLTAPATVIGGVEGTHYALGFANGSRPAGMFAVDTESGTVSRIANWPGRDFSLAYEGAGLHHISGGRLFVLWPEPVESVPGPTYGIYAIDPASGAIEKQPG